MAAASGSERRCRRRRVNDTNGRFQVIPVLLPGVRRGISKVIRFSAETRLWHSPRRLRKRSLRTEDVGCAGREDRNRCSRRFSFPIQFSFRTSLRRPTNFRVAQTIRSDRLVLTSTQTAGYGANANRLCALAARYSSARRNSLTYEIKPPPFSTVASCCCLSNSMGAHNRVLTATGRARCDRRNHGFALPDLPATRPRRYGRRLRS